MERTPMRLPTRCKQKNVPFIFATGYGSTGLRPGYGTRPVLQKPFQQKDLEMALTEALGGFEDVTG